MLIGIDASRANLYHKNGPEWYSYYLIRWFAKLDKENDYILYSDKPLKGGLKDLTTDQSYAVGDENEKYEIDKKGFQKIKSPYGNFKAKILKWPFKYFWTQGRMSLEMIFFRPDVLFIPAHVLPIVHPKKAFVTIHDIGSSEFKNDIYEGQIGSFDSSRKCLLNFFVKVLTFGKYQVNACDYLKWSTQFAIKHAEKIITNSNFTKNDLKKRYNTSREIEVIHNGYNSFIYKPVVNLEKIEKVKKIYGIEGDFILYIGRIERRKNISTLIEAYAILKEKYKNLEYKLVLVGNASFGYDEINYVIREFDLIDDVIITGWIKETNVPFLFNGAKAFVFPSNHEGFGLPLLQAMATGTPIAASFASSIPEVVQDAALFFNPKYALSISDALSKVLFDEEVRQNLISKGFKRIKDFSWEKTAKKTLKIIKD